MDTRRKLPRNVNEYKHLIKVGGTSGDAINWMIGLRGEDPTITSRSHEGKPAFLKPDSETRELSSRFDQSIVDQPGLRTRAGTMTNLFKKTNPS